MLVSVLIQHICYPLNIGILIGFSALGPAVGYVVGGQLLTIYVDFDTVIVKK